MTEALHQTLAQLNELLGGKLIKDTDYSQILVDNDDFYGNIKAFSSSSHLSVINFNLVSEKDIEIGPLFSNRECLHFVSCLEGYLVQKHDNNDVLNTLNRRQNLILSCRTNSRSNVKLPAKQRLKATVVTVSIKSNDELHALKFDDSVLEILEESYINEPFVHFSHISSKHMVFAKQLIDLNFSNLSDRLLAEGLALQNVASQFKDFETSEIESSLSSGLSKLEENKLINLAQFIQDNIDRPMKLEQLVEYIGVGEKKLQRGFKKLFNCSVNKYILSVRLDKAKELLRDDTNTISEIVYSIGLNSRSYFSSIFKKEFGLLPSEYRKEYLLEDPIYEYCYASEAMDNLRKSHIQAILNESTAWNSEHNLTGCLLYHNQQFFQIIEGSKSDVENIVSKIKKDYRHFNIKKVFSGYKSGRLFPEWHLAFIGDASLRDQNLFLENSRQLDMDSFSIGLLKDKEESKAIWEATRNHLLAEELRDQKMGKK
ncbi:BLUF domain-containing protein [Winogradskyella maritima]|uniref:BLUF domain-containing protein n=1 Tax=Winogradskyella maritima TaxID=1517766 RepID=A0ABV8AGI7_9FLAO|nr:BLUF domain-containing protein [Winogradskyella maritima]